jgi:hypothetical protein
VSPREEREWIAPEERDDVPRAWSGVARGWERRIARFAPGTRPWNWMELDAAEADLLWALLEKFVDFFNVRYADQSSRRIPPCWPEHGALVEEVTTLWWARWQAFESPHASIGGAQYWHTYTLPGFLERMRRWLGDELLTCQQGRHRDRDDPPLATAEGWCHRLAAIARIDRTLRDEPDALTDRSERERANRSIVEVPFLERHR